MQHIRYLGEAKKRRFAYKPCHWNKIYDFRKGLFARQDLSGKRGKRRGKVLVTMSSEEISFVVQK